MKNTSLYSDFIRAIEELYSSISLKIHQKRMDAYHSASATDDANGRHSDFTASLYQYIDDVSAQAQKTTPEKPARDQAGFANATHPYPPAHLEVASKDINSGLTKHFKEQHSAGLYPGISGKMKDSIREHLHASIRYARQGNAQAAKMHAEIANNAYKELAHYLTNEEYAALAREIEEEFDTLVSNKKMNPE